MNKKTTIGWMLSAGIMLAGTSFVTSCSSDDNIDLGELDKTIGVGSDGFTLPSSSTKKSPLGDLLELKSDGVIDTLKHDSANYKTGDYRFMKADSIKTVKPKIKEVKFSHPDSKSVGFDIKIDSKMEATALAAKATGIEKVFYFPFEGDPTKVGQPKRVLNFSYGGDPNEHVISLTEADIDGTITLNIGLDALKGKVEFAALDLYLPEFLNIDESDLNINPSEYTIEHNLSAPMNEYWKLTLKRVKTDNALNLKLKVKKLTNFKPTIDPTWTEDDPYLFFGKKTVSGEEVTVPELNAVIKLLMTLNSKDFQTSCAGDYQVNSSIDLGESIAITHAEGKFDPDINIEETNAQITGVPDFLDDERVSILLSNPSIKLDIESNLDVKGLADAKLVAQYKSKKGVISYKTLDVTKTQQIILNPATSSSVKSTIVVCRKKGTDPTIQYIEVSNESNPLEQTPISGRQDSVEVKDLAALLNSIPENIKIILDANADKNYIGKIDFYAEGKEKETDHGCGYKIKPSYNFSSPLELLPGSTIVYNDTIDGWNKDLVDNKIEFYGDNAHIFIEADVTNESPLLLNIKNPKVIGVKDKKGVAPEISSAKVVITNAAGVEQSFITINNSGKLYLKVSGSLKELDGIIFEVEANSAITQALNASKHTIKIDNLKIHLNGRITIDLED